MNIDERLRYINILYTITAEKLETNTEKDWDSILVEWETGIDAFFTNKNSRLLPDDKIISILEIMKQKNQRFFDYTFYNVLYHSKKVQEWVINNLKPEYTNELYIEDPLNY